MSGSEPCGNLRGHVHDLIDRYPSPLDPLP